MQRCGVKCKGRPANAGDASICGHGRYLIDPQQADWKLPIFHKQGPDGLWSRVRLPVAVKTLWYEWPDHLPIRPTQEFRDRFKLGVAAHVLLDNPDFILHEIEEHDSHGYILGITLHHKDFRR